MSGNELLDLVKSILAPLAALIGLVVWLVRGEALTQAEFPSMSFGRAG